MAMKRPVSVLGLVCVRVSGDRVGRAGSRIRRHPPAAPPAPGAAARTATVRDPRRRRARRRHRRERQRRAGDRTHRRRLRARGQRPAAQRSHRAVHLVAGMKTAAGSAAPGRRQQQRWPVDRPAAAVRRRRELPARRQRARRAAHGGARDGERCRAGDLVGLARLPTGRGGVEFTTDRERIRRALSGTMGAQPSRSTERVRLSEAHAFESNDRRTWEQVDRARMRRRARRRRRRSARRWAARRASTSSKRRPSTS